jgi:hypothetical protein
MQLNVFKDYGMKVKPLNKSYLTAKVEREFNSKKVYHPTDQRNVVSTCGSPMITGRAPFSADGDIVRIKTAGDTLSSPVTAEHPTRPISFDNGVPPPPQRDPVAFAAKPGNNSSMLKSSPGKSTLD